MGYYEVVDGVKMDKDIIDAAKEAVAGRGDGRVSVSDAKIILEKVKDGNSYTPIERITVGYVLQNFNWTDEAEEWFTKELDSCRRLLSTL